MAQLSYPTEMNKAIAGMPGDAGESDVLTKTADAAIPFGRVVADGATISSVKLPDDAADVVAGVSMRTLAQVSTDLDEDQYDAGLRWKTDKT